MTTLDGNPDKTNPIRRFHRIILIVVSVVFVLAYSSFLSRAFVRDNPKAPFAASPQKNVEVRMAKESTSGTTAVFAAGCFWCSEAAFEQLDGVSSVESGYAGGDADTANYEAVCTGLTGHAEAIRVAYDPARISYDQLLDVFFDAHDPTQLNRQGNDVGTQYRSAIFFANDAEHQAAEKKIEKLNASKKLGKPIATTLEPLTAFYAAENYHQGFAGNNPLHPYIQAASVPKVCKVREKHAELIRKE